MVFCLKLARLDTFLHHFDPAASTAEMVVLCRCTAPARPAKLVFAKGTSHVITAAIALDWSLADRTPHGILLVLL